MVTRGLYHKFNVTRADGTPIDPGAVYFVLRLDRPVEDRAARLALRIYACEVGDTNPDLADDLWALLKRVGVEPVEV